MWWCEYLENSIGHVQNEGLRSWSPSTILYMILYLTHSSKWSEDRPAVAAELRKLDLLLIE